MTQMNTDKEENDEFLMTNDEFPSRAKSACAAFRIPNSEFRI